MYQHFFFVAQSQREAFAGHERNEHPDEHRRDLEGAAGGEKPEKLFF